MGNVLADLLEVTSLEVSDVLSDFHESMVEYYGADETRRFAAMIRNALEKTGPMSLVDKILGDPTARKRIVEVLGYTMSSLEYWNPQEEEEEIEEEDLF